MAAGDAGAAEVEVAEQRAFMTKEACVGGGGSDALIERQMSDDPARVATGRLAGELPQFAGCQSAVVDAHLVEGAVKPVVGGVGVGIGTEDEAFAVAVIQGGGGEWHFGYGFAVDHQADDRGAGVHHPRHMMPGAVVDGLAWLGGVTPVAEVGKKLKRCSRQCHDFIEKNKASEHHHSRSLTPES